MVACPNQQVRITPRARFRASYLVLLLTLAPAAPSVQAQGSYPTLPWRSHFEQALAEARDAGRPLWLQFTGSWCGFCHKMEAETFPDPQVAALGRDAYIPLKVDAEDRPDLMARFGIGGLPATVLFDPSGQVLARHEGFAEPTRFLSLLQAHLGASVASHTAEIALAGCDPVSLVEGEGLVPGHPALRVRHDGLEFRFAAVRDRDEFLAAPERFVPVLRGHCPVRLQERRERVEGDPRCGVYYQGRLYLCADEHARRQFADDPDRYADVDLADDGHCPHCRSVAGRLVPGNPRFSTIHEGRRYLFPDPAHRAAFRSAPETYVR